MFKKVLLYSFAITNSNSEIHEMWDCKNNLLSNEFQSNFDFSSVKLTELKKDYEDGRYLWQYYYSNSENCNIGFSPKVYDLFPSIDLYDCNKNYSIRFNFDEGSGFLIKNEAKYKLKYGFFSKKFKCAGKCVLEVDTSEKSCVLR